jgi:DNA-binding response OmpR family regulator
MGIKVLVVEDEEPIAQMVLEVLHRSGVEADWATDGVQAREFLERFTYDLVLTDIIFTRTGGLDLIRWIRERDKTIPVVAMTGFGTSAAQEAREAGASDVILKPFKLKELKARLSRFIPLGQGGA